MSSLGVWLESGGIHIVKIIEKIIKSLVIYYRFYSLSEVCTITSRKIVDTANVNIENSMDAYLWKSEIIRISTIKSRHIFN